MTDCRLYWSVDLATCNPVLQSVREASRLGVQKHSCNPAGAYKRLKHPYPHLLLWMTMESLRIRPVVAQSNSNSRMMPHPWRCLYCHLAHQMHFPNHPSSAI